METTEERFEEVSERVGHLAWEQQIDNCRCPLRKQTPHRGAKSDYRQQRLSAGCLPTCECIFDGVLKT